MEVRGASTSEGWAVALREDGRGSIGGGCTAALDSASTARCLGVQRTWPVLGECPAPAALGEGCPVPRIHPALARPHSPSVPRAQHPPLPEERRGRREPALAHAWYAADARTMPGLPGCLYHKNAADIRNEGVQLVVAENLVEYCALHLRSPLTKCVPLWPLRSARSVPSASNRTSDPCLIVNLALPWPN